MATSSPKLPLTDKPGVGNWVEKYHALPKGSWIRRAAEHIHAKGHPTGTSIAFAVNAAKKMCREGDTNFPGVQQVSAGSRADACAALTIWNTAKAKAKASKDLSAGEWFRAIDLAGPRLARGLDLTERQAELIDLAFRPDQARGFHGRWVKIVNGIKGLKPGESKTFHGPSGTKIKKLSTGGYKVSAHGRDQHASTPGKAATVALDALVRATAPQRVGRNMSAGSDHVVDLATPVATARSAQPLRRNGLYDVAATVKRLRKNPKLKNLPAAQLQRIAAARIARRQVRNRLGITDLKKLAPSQVKALERAGLIGGGKAKAGTVVSYTIQRGPRKGQTITIRRTASGWHEVKPHATAGSGRKVA